MAKLEQGILGPFRGKVGTVVGYLWRGKHVVRAYRREINYPNTEHQQAEREWFVGMVRFAATARQALLLGLRERAARDGMTEGNAFVKMNKSCFGRDAACRVRSETPLRPAATSPCEGEERKNTICNQEYTTSNQTHTPFGCSSLPRSAADMVSYGLTADAARRVRSETPLRPAATSPCEGEERENTISNQRYANSNQTYTPSSCSPLQGAAVDMASCGSTADAACRVRSGMAPLRPAATSPCEGEERKNTISNQVHTSNQVYTASKQKYTTRNQTHTPSGRSPLQGELPEGVRGGVDYERIRIAEGPAAPVRFTTASVDENKVLHVDFEKNSGMTRAKASDSVYVYVYNIDTREGLLSHPAERRRGRLEMQLPEGWNHQNVKLWGFVVDGEGRASASQYVAMDVLEDGDVADVADAIESPDRAFNEANMLGQAIERDPLTGCGADATLWDSEKKIDKFFISN